MAIVLRRHRLAFAIVDPVEIRSSGEIAKVRTALRLMLHQLLLREKPTALVAGRGLRDAARATGAIRGVPLVDTPRHLLDEATAAGIYPELPLFTTTSLVDEAALLAITTLLTSTFPSRRYAHRRPAPLRPPARKIRSRRDAHRPRPSAPGLP